MGCLCVIWRRCSMLTAGTLNSGVGRPATGLGETAGPNSDGHQIHVGIRART